VCLCDTRRNCIKTAKRRITQTTPRDSPGTLVFWRQNSLVDDPLPPEICAQIDPPPFKNHNFDQYLLIAPQPWELAKICSISSISTHFPTSHRMNRVRYPYIQQRVAQNEILLFSPVKFNFGRKKSFTTFLCVNTSRGKVIETSFLYLTVHRWIAGDVPIYQKIALKVTHLFRKRRFRQISINSAAAMRTSEKSWTIANRKSIMRFPSSHRWTPCVTPKSPKGGSKWEFLHFELPFISSLQVIVDTLNLVCGLNIASPSLRTANCPWKGRDHCHVTALIFGK